MTHASTGGRRRAMTRLASLPIVAVTIAAMTPMPAHAASTRLIAMPATAEAREGTCAEPTDVSQQDAWANQMIAPQRAWPFTRGSGVTIAVLGSGVDANHPQLKGRVKAGLDAIAPAGTAQDDCLGAGTQVAGVIAAAAATTGGFAGVAPLATILPIRIATATTSGALVAPPEVLASGIDAAVRLGADVIAVAAVTYTDTAALRAAVAAALARNIVVVAAVGDLGDATATNPDPFPAMYPGVLGVGAVDRTGRAWTKSQHGAYVDLVAPGVGVTTLQRGQGTVSADGTAIACGYVAGAAALVRSRRSLVTAAEINQVLVATAATSVGGESYGYGIVNAYAAVTEQLVSATPVALPVVVRPDGESSSIWASSRRIALAGAGVALVLALAVALAAVTLPRGRRRAWRTRLAAAPRTDIEPDEPGPPVQLFDEHQPARDS